MTMTNTYITIYNNSIKYYTFHVINNWIYMKSITWSDDGQPPQYDYEPILKYYDIIYDHIMDSFTLSEELLTFILLDHKHD